MKSKQTQDANTSRHKTKIKHQDKHRKINIPAQKIYNYTHAHKKHIHKHTPAHKNRNTFHVNKSPCFFEDRRSVYSTSPADLCCRNVPSVSYVQTRQDPNLTCWAVQVDLGPTYYAGNSNVVLL